MLHDQNAVKSGIQLADEEPSFEALVALGRHYAAQHCSDTWTLKTNLLHSWLEEEVLELRLALDEGSLGAQLDALLDLLGLLFVGLALYSSAERRDGFRSYVKAQTSRGRPVAWWTRIIRTALHLMSGVGSRSADRALYGKMGKRLIRAARAHPSRDEILALWPEDTEATASACHDATPPVRSNRPRLSWTAPPSTF